MSKKKKERKPQCYRYNVKQHHRRGEGAAVSVVTLRQAYDVMQDKWLWSCLSRDATIQVIVFPFFPNITHFYVETNKSPRPHREMFNYPTYRHRVVWERPCSHFLKLWSQLLHFNSPVNCKLSCH